MSTDQGSDRINILLVDDNPLVLSLLQEQLRPEGVELTTTSDAGQARQLLQEGGFDIVVAGQELRGTTGLDLLGHVRGSASRVLLTSNLSLRELLQAREQNKIETFVTKPWRKEDLVAILQTCVAIRCASEPVQPQHQVDATSGQNAFESVVESAPPGAEHPGSQAIHRGSVDAALLAFNTMLNAFHPNLGNTALRAAALCAKIAELQNFSQPDADALVWAAYLHDISLVGMDRPVVRRWLRNPDKLTPEEMAAIKRHPLLSQEMLAPYEVFQKAGEIIRSHHEHWDGTGYPDGLKAETIPTQARILAAVICYCGRHGSHAQNAAELKSHAEKLFDPAVVDLVIDAATQVTMPRGKREIPITELATGMVLARDINNTTGVMILAKDKELTTAWLNKIMAINSTTPLEPYVLVYC